MRRSMRLNASVVGLVLACLFWGISFPLMQMAIDSVSRAAGWSDRTMLQDLALRATFNGARFVLATGLYGVLTFKKQRGYTPADVRGGVIVGLFFTAGLFFQLLGLRYALPSVSAVLTSMVVVFTPLAQFLLIRRPVGAITWQAVLIALVGVVILSMPNPFAVTQLTFTIAPPIPWLGEGATLLASMLFTGQVLSVDRYGRDADPTRLTFLMFVVTALTSLALGFALGGGALFAPSILSNLVADASFLRVTVAVVVLSSVGAFHFMNTSQPHVSPAVASVVYCMEPVFATMWSVFFRTESMTLLTFVGGGLVILAMVRLARAHAYG
jgi:drug/metabolite transporter (DMT)-like permease